MKQCFTKRCGLALVLMLFAFVQGVWAEETTKKAPVITFTPEAATATIGQETFTTPTVGVTIDNKPARKYFRVTYKIDNGTYLKTENGKADSVDNLNHKIWIDSKTGTTVNEYTGIVKIGAKGAGTVTVIATATPSKLYGDKYTSGTGNYSIVISAPTDFNLHVSQNGNDITDEQVVRVISAKIKNHYGGSDTKILSDTAYIDPIKVTYAIGSRNISATKDFDINNPTITNSNDKIKIEAIWVDKDGKVTTDATKRDHVAKFAITSTSDADLTNVPVTFTVKTTSDGTTKYGEEKTKSVSFKVDVKYYDATTGTNKIKTYLVFPERIQHKYKFPYHTDPLPQSPKIYDENGNDVTKYYDYTSYGLWTWHGVRSYQYSDNPLDKGDNLKAKSGANLPGDFSRSDYTSMHLDDNKYGVNIYDGNPKNASNAASWPDDYIVTVNAKLKASYDTYNFGDVFADKPLITEREGSSIKKKTVKGIFYDANNKDQYELEPGEYVLRVHKRCPEINLYPSPESVSIAQNYEMTNFNRFNITANFKPENGVSGTADSLSYQGLDGREKYWYGFFVPNDLKYVEGENIPDGQVRIEVDNGLQDRLIEGLTLKLPVYDPTTGKQEVDGDKPIYRSLEGNMYLCKKDWGNDQWKITFHGTGHIPIYYYVFPWDQVQWDRSSYSVRMFHIVQTEPVFLKLDPSSYTIKKGETAPKPHVWVEDQFGKDISRFYNFTWTVTSNGTDSKPIINHDNTTHTSLGVNLGTADITISATRKPEGDEVWNDSIGYGVYNDPTGSVVHKVVVTSEKTLYEVIYDDNYYLKDASGNLVSDKAKADDNSADATHPIPNREHAWTSKMGKLHFINNDDDYTTPVEFATGQFEEEQTPGLNIVFGNGSDTDPWIVMPSDIITENAYDGDFDKHGAIVVRANAALFGATANETDEANLVEMPTVSKKALVSGGCLQLTPTTNGYLQIDGNYGTDSEPVTYYLADVTDGVTVDNKGKELYIDHLSRPNSIGEAPEDKTTYDSKSADIDKPQLKEENGVMYGDLRFRYALLQGHTYYLFSDANTFVLHGLTFMPAYVVMREDNNSAHKATIFADNGFSGDLPMIIKSKEDKVSFSRTWDDDAWDHTYTPTKKDGSSGDPVEANDVLVIKDGYKFIGKRYTTEKRLRVRASVKGINRTGQTITLGSETKQLGQVERAPYIDVAVVGIPVYKVGSDFTGVDAGERVSTTNFVTRIWMTFGGWEHSSAEQGTYPYYNKMSLDDKQLSDAWKVVGEIDSVGMNNATIDGFKYNTGATNNPVDENGFAWKYNLENGNTPNTFNLPVRGGYVKFEPEESGTLMVYVLQNGLTDIVQNSGRKLENQPNELRRRAMYIVDETGAPVQFASGKGTNTIWGNSSNKDMNEAFAENEGSKSSDYDYMTEGRLRCNFDNNPSGKAFDFATRWASNYEKGTDDADYKADVKAIEDSWKAKSIGDVQDVIRLKDGSFVVPTKSFVRYTFNVKSGKTYYVWCSGSKLNFCGFAFVPTGFMSRTENNDWPAIDQDNDKANNMSIEEARAALPEPNDSKYSYAGIGNGVGYYDQNIYEGGKDAGDAKNNNKITNGAGATTTYSQPVSEANVNFVNVTLNRTFKNNEWTSICLPFSVSQSQVKALFGNNSMVVTFDSVMTKHKVYTDFYQTEEPTDIEARTAHFTCHVNQLIEAGRPYFIKPAFSDNKDHTSIEFKHVSLEAVKPMTIECKNDSAISDSVYAKNMIESLPETNLTDEQKAQKSAWEKLKKDKAIFTYSFAGIYDRTQIPWYSYVMGAQTVNGEVENGLWRIVPDETKAGSSFSVYDKTNWPYLKGFRAYLYPSKDENGEAIKLEETGSSLAKYWITGAEVYGDAGNGTATGIEQLVEEMNTMMTAGHKGVYNLKGQMVRMENNINGLPAGVYIMNGKKYLVK